LAFIAKDPIKEIQYKLIFHNFLISEPDASSLKTYYSRFDPHFYSDSTVFFHDSTQIGESIYKPNGRYLIRNIESSYYSSPGFVYRYTRDIFGEDYPSEEFVKKVKQQFGLSPFSKTVYTARNEAWHFWSGVAFEKIFKKYYGKPKNTFQYVTYGFIYDIAAKKYMKDYVFLLNHLMVTKKSEWKTICNKYQQQALTDSTFNGSIASYTAYEQLFSTSELLQLKVIEKSYLYIPIGELIRRQIDGSLPAIIRCIRTLLLDYDPETYKQLKV
jgi:hypothetical protein